MRNHAWCPLRAWLADYAAGNDPMPRHFAVARRADGYPVGHVAAVASGGLMGERMDRRGQAEAERYAKQEGPR